MLKQVLLGLLITSYSIAIGQVDAVSVLNKVSQKYKSLNSLQANVSLRTTNKDSDIDETNEISDFNSDGFLDLKIEYTKLDDEDSYYWPRAIRNEMMSEYLEKVKTGQLSKGLKKFDDYETEQWELNHNFGMYGDGYITRYSNNGLIHFFTLD